MITDHAIDNCLERVMDLDSDKATKHERNKAEKLIKGAYNTPNDIVTNEDEKWPIYIKGDVAIPVKGDAIPTTYNSKVFRA